MSKKATRNSDYYMKVITSVYSINTNNKVNPERIIKHTIADRCTFADHICILVDGRGVLVFKGSTCIKGEEIYFLSVSALRSYVKEKYPHLLNDAEELTKLAAKDLGLGLGELQLTKEQTESLEKAENSKPAKVKTRELPSRHK